MCHISKLPGSSTVKITINVMIEIIRAVKVVRETSVCAHLSLHTISTVSRSLMFASGAEILDGQYWFDF